MKQGFYHEYGLRILFVVVFLLALVWLGTRRTFESNSNAVEDWLPEQYQETQDYHWFQKYFPFESFIVASWEGCTVDDDRIELFAQKLVPDQTIENFSLFSPGKTIRADIALDPQTQSLLAQQAQSDAALSQLPDREKESKEEKNSQEDDIRSSFRSVMTGPRLIRLLEQSYERVPQNQSAEELRDEILTRLSGTLIGPDKESTAMIITLNSGFKGGGKRIQKLIDYIKQVSVECGLPDTTEVKEGSVASRAVGHVKDVIHEIIYGRSPRTDALILGGPPTDNAALDQEGTRTLFRLAFICAIVSLTLAMICLHDFRLTMFVFWVAILSAGVALAMVSFTGGKCDSILLSMPALVYVLAMSGAIHLINYYHDSIREIGLEGAMERAVSHAFSPCFFAQLTTAIGLGSLFAGNLTPITNFGFYSAIGVLMTLLLLFFYLPALLDVFPSRKFAQKHGGKGLSDTDGTIEKFWVFFGKFIVRYHNWVTLFCLLMMGFFGYYLPKIKTSVKLMNFFSPDAEIIAHYTWLEGKLGPLVPLELVVCFDNAQLPASCFDTVDRLQLIEDISRNLKEKLASDVGGTLSVAMFTPSLSANWQPGSLPYRIASSAVSKGIEENRAALSDYLSVEGNPTLDEMIALLSEHISEDSANTQKKRNELMEILKNSEEDPSILGQDPTLSENSGLAWEPDLPAIESSPFAAEIQNLFAKESDVLQMIKKRDTLQECKVFLEGNDITNLEEMTDRLEYGRPFYHLTGNQVDSLLSSCKFWQEQRGIELWRISIRVWSLKKDIDYSQFILDVKGVVDPILQEVSYEIYPERTETSDEVRAEFGSAHANDTIYPAGITAKYTGTVPLVYKTQHALILGLANSIIMAFFLIAFVFMVILRSVPGGLVAMLPNIFPVVVVFGFMAWLGILVDVGTMMTASVALGVAVDDTMHYLTWFSEAIARGKTPQESAVQAYKRCATAMTQSTLIAGVGLSAFMFSTFIPTQRFGVLMLSILFMALMGDLIFLPSLLTGPAGRFFYMRRKAKRSPGTEESPALETEKKS